jgi:hypothetical protein
MSSEIKWLKCDGEIWDYEKTFYEVKLWEGTRTWVWPNAGKLTDVSFSDTSGQPVPIESVTHYREAEEDYYEMMESRDED